VATNPIYQFQMPINFPQLNEQNQNQRSALGAPALQFLHNPMSFFGHLIGNLVAATLPAEASQALNQLDYRALRAYSGIAPVTKRSGKRLSVMIRQACNERLRNAIYHWSQLS
jgi:surfactin synthase thioesterase subunit